MSKLKAWHRRYQYDVVSSFAVLTLSRDQNYRYCQIKQAAVKGVDLMGEPLQTSEGSKMLLCSLHDQSRGYLVLTLCPEQVSLLQNIINVPFSLIYIGSSCSWPFLTATLFLEDNTPCPRFTMTFRSVSPIEKRGERKANVMVVSTLQSKDRGVLTHQKIKQ